MTRIPLLADSRVVVAETGVDDVVLRPPEVSEALDDVQLRSGRRSASRSTARLSRSSSRAEAPRPW